MVSNSRTGIVCTVMIRSVQIIDCLFWTSLDVRSVAETFVFEHRFEFVAKHNGVIFDDNSRGWRQRQIKSWAISTTTIWFVPVFISNERNHLFRTANSLIGITFRNRMFDCSCIAIYQISLLIKILLLMQNHLLFLVYFELILNFFGTAF